MSAESAFPELFHARPEWPNRDDEHLFWVGLNSRFSFAHHPVKAEDQGAEQRDAKEEVLSFFCRPGRAADQLQSYLQHSISGGSVLVTGYRGTGKTSLVNHCLDQLRTVAREKLEVAARDMLSAAWRGRVPRHGRKALQALKSAVPEPRQRVADALGHLGKVSCSGQGGTHAHLEAAWRKLDTCAQGYGLIKIRVNMATVTCAHDVLVLTFDGLIEWVTAACAVYAGQVKELEDERKRDGMALPHEERTLRALCEDRKKSLHKIKQALEGKLRDLRSQSSVEHQSSPRLEQFPSAASAVRQTPGVSSEQSFGREALSRHQAGLVEQICELKKLILPDKIVFVFDEVDKLMPVDDWADDKPEDESREIKKLETLQQIVADLKCFLSESPSHQIFIAGKDVDDSWAEDQNRGEGIFESIFASNINVASIFTLELEPCLPPLPREIRETSTREDDDSNAKESDAEGAKAKESDAEDFYTVLAGQLGIPKNSLVYRTALLVLPHLAEYEIVQLLTRAYLRKPRPKDAEGEKLKKWLMAYADFVDWDQPGLMTEVKRKQRVAKRDFDEAKAALKKASLMDWVLCWRWFALWWTLQKRESALRKAANALEKTVEDFAKKWADDRKKAVVASTPAVEISKRLEAAFKAAEQRVNQAKDELHSTPLLNKICPWIKLRTEQRLKDAEADLARVHDMDKVWRDFAKKWADDRSTAVMAAAGETSKTVDAAEQRVAEANAELDEAKKKLAEMEAELSGNILLNRIFSWKKLRERRRLKQDQEKLKKNLEASLEEAEAGLARARRLKKVQCDLSQAHACHNEAQTDLENARKLYAKTSLDLATKLTNYEDKQTRFRQKSDSLKTKEAGVDQAATTCVGAIAAFVNARGKFLQARDALDKAKLKLANARAALKKAWTALNDAEDALEKASAEHVRASAEDMKAAASLRALERISGTADIELKRAWDAFLEARTDLRAEKGDAGASNLPGEDHTPWFALSPMSERTCRRLRILMEYLTYKGRGIPRKVLREFYTMVRPSSSVPNDDPGFRKLWKRTEKDRTDRYGRPGADDEKNLRVVRHVLAFPQHHLQKMNFYASIVEHLDRNFALLRGLNDKGRVSIFHIIDYLLKFYGTGFSHRDLEHAPFMTAREELFPSRQLAALILRIMDGKLWKRKDTRSPEYRMLHHVAHDLAVMFLRYGPEQMELRHTLKDFRDEVPRLRKALDGSVGVTTDQRLAPIHAQLRLARIYELCGRHYEARLGYYGAVRWLRQDISHFEQAGSTVQHVQRQARQVGQPPAPAFALVLPPAKSSAKATAKAVLHAMAPVPEVQMSWSQAAHTPGFSVAFVSYLVECHLALGRLLEEVGEQRAAVHHYEEACSLCDPYFSHPQTEEKVHERVRLGGGDTIPRHIDYGERLWSTLFEENRIELPASPADSSPQAPFDAERLARVLARRPPMRPLKLSGVPQGYVQVCNQAAIAYSKLWERSSANAYFLRALVHLDEIGDEYGLVEQLFFIGQVMVRRRDLVAAAFWYRAALLKSRAIRMHSTPDGGGQTEEQTGAGWQTPPVITTLEAQITAALGDVIFATGGHAFYVYAPSPNDAKRNFRSPSSENEAQSAIWSFIRAELGHASPLQVDDRWEEFFFTQTRRLFEAGEHDIDARDVYLRQLESRFCRFEHAIGLLDKPESCLSAGQDACAALNEYTALNAWTTFWRGARVLLHRNLVTVTSLARDERHMWGHIADFRRMGTTLRLIGSMLLELGLRANDAKSRKVLLRASQTMESVKGRPPKINNVSAASVQFYQRFLGESDKNQGSDEDWLGLVTDAVRGHLGARAGYSDAKIKNCMPDDIIATRINVNTAAADILTIFAYLGDRGDLLGANLQDARSIEDVGGRSPLFRVNGDDENALPIARAYKSLQTPGAARSKELADDLASRFKLLALAEKALLSSYLCYRDCIPDFSYAQSCVKMGELYVAALYKLGEWISDNKYKAEAFTPEIAQAVLGFTEHGKRFLTKAVDILNREQEQNRNTFHLMSEAWFNLADILTLRLLAVTGNTSKLGTELFGPEKVSEKIVHDIDRLDKQARERTTGSKNARHAIRDLVPEDLRRQIQEAYQSGLHYVQSEMNDCSSRYRVPGDVLYAHRNLMDPVLHFRICSSIRLRHSGGRHDASNMDARAVRARFEDITHDICDRISGYESPQLSYDDEGGKTPSRAWAAKLSELIKFANKVRTDRGPLVVETDPKKIPWQVVVKWFSVTEPVKVAGEDLVPEQFIFFASGKGG